MDLAKLDLEAASAAGIDVELKHPIEMVHEDRMNEATGKPYKMLVPAPLVDDDGNQVTIKIHGSESSAFKASQRIHRQRLKDLNDTTGEEFAKVVIEVLIDCTISWENVKFNGEEYECTRENIEKLYRNPGYDWLVKQLFAASGDKSLIPLN